ncbi:MAG: hypothetical protein L3K06_06005, partial [Thermoplasmata archaeon]|nr:hypothetical protein [Thermoplasmata archaeon]
MRLGPLAMAAALSIALGLLPLAIMAAGDANPGRAETGRIAGAGLFLSSDLFVSISVSPTFPQAGQTLTLTTTVYGNGTGPFSYSWSGLPSGCASSNTPQLSCTPTASGSFQVGATVWDAQGDFGSGAATVLIGPDTGMVVGGIFAI